MKRTNLSYIYFVFKVLMILLFQRTPYKYHGVLWTEMLVQRTLISNTIVV